MNKSAVVLVSAILGMGVLLGVVGWLPTASVRADGVCSGYYRIALPSGQNMTESDVAATDCSNVTDVTYEIHLPAAAASGFESELGIWPVTVDIDYYYDMPPGHFYTVANIQTSDGNDPASYTLSTLTASGSRSHTINSYTNVSVRNKV